MKFIVCLLICLALILPSTPPSTHAQSERTIAYDETVTDTLAPDQAVHQWEFDGAAGDVIIITLHSTDFAPTIQLRDPDGFELREDSAWQDSNARIITILPNHGRYAIYAGTRTDARGDYSLTLNKYDLSDAGRIAYGEQHFSLMSAVGDPEWQFEGRRGDVVSVSVNSLAFDPRITLIAPGVSTIAADDDSGSGLNAFMVTMLPVDGFYTIEVDSFGGDTGLYSITLDSVTADEIVTYGDTIDGELTLGGQVYLFEGQEGDVIRTSVTSSEFDPRIAVRDSAGSPLAVDDDSGDGANTQLVMPIYSNGLYIITIYPFSDDQFGAFTLSLDNAEMTAPQHLQIGDTVHSGLIETGQQSWTFEAEANTPIDITLNSYGFSTTLTLALPDGNQVAMDTDSGESDSAHILTVLPADGDYTITVNSLVGGLGAYTLSIQAPTIESSLNSGDVYEGDLASGSGMFTFRGNSGESYTILLESDSFDPQIDLIGPDGILLASDDDSGGNLSALLDLTLPDDGIYTLIVHSFDNSSFGAYTLSINP